MSFAISKDFETVQFPRIFLTHQVCSYTLLLLSEVPRYLGCCITKMDVAGLIKVQREKTPRPLDKLASRDELKTWLSRILFCTLCPGQTSQKQMDRVHYPNNLVVFIDLLIHLHNVGYPSHWLSGFLSTVLADTLVSDVAPYLGNFPIPVSERIRRVQKRKVNLAPWHADLEHVLAVSYEALPFPIALPSGFATSADDIGAFTVYAPLHNFDMATRSDIYKVTFPVISLLFFKDGSPYFKSPKYGADKVPEILEGKLGTKGEVHIVTIVDAFDMLSETIRWRMSRQRVRKMKDEGWSMAPYRHDVRVSREYLVFGCHFVVDCTHGSYSCLSAVPCKQLD